MEINYKLPLFEVAIKRLQTNLKNIYSLNITEKWYILKTTVMKEQFENYNRIETVQTVHNYDGARTFSFYILLWREPRELSSICNSNANLLVYVTIKAFVLFTQLALYCLYKRFNKQTFKYDFKSKKNKLHIDLVTYHITCQSITKCNIFQAH